MTDERVACALVEQFRLGGVARDIRMMAAQGLLPLRPEDLVELWTGLAHDADKGVQAAAARSLMSLPTAEILPILKRGETPAKVLSCLFAHRSEQELRDAVLQSTALPDATIEALAAVPPPALAELVAINRRRVMRRTSLVVLRELREAFQAEEAAADPPPAPPEPDMAPAGDVFMTEDEAMMRYLSEKERQETDKVSGVQMICRLNAAEKVITALKGTREERALLIRDPSGLVWSTVLSSPRLTDSEIESFSAMTKVSGETLRYIGNHPEWAKRKGVAANLLNNPRTPEVIRQRVREVTTGSRPRGEERVHTERATLVRQVDALLANTRRSALALKGKLTSDERLRILDAIETAAKTLKAQSQADPEDRDKLEGFFALAPGEQDLLLRLSRLVVTTGESLRESEARLEVEVRERILAALERAEAALNRGGLDELRACVDEVQGAGRLLDRVGQPGGTGG
jgi:hypothetical protein